MIPYLKQNQFRFTLLNTKLYLYRSDPGLYYAEVLRKGLTHVCTDIIKLTFHTDTLPLSTFGRKYQIAANFTAEHTFVSLIFMLTIRR